MLAPLCATCSAAAATVSLCGACALGLAPSHDELGEHEAFLLLQKARRAESAQGGLAVLRGAGVVWARRR